MIVHSLAALAIIVAAAIVLRVLWRRLWAPAREPGRLRLWLAEHTGTPVFVLIVAAGAQIIFRRAADSNALRDLPLTPYIIGATYIATVLGVTWVIYGLVKGLSEWYLTNVAPKTATPLDTTLIPAIRRIVMLVLIFVAATVVLEHYDVKLTALLGLAGVGSLAVALAAQDTLANMIAGFTIILDRPFRLGDRLELADGRIGDVHEIGLRSTKILSFDHTVYIIPNAELAKSSVINHSYPTEKIKVRQNLPLAYGNEVEKAKQIVLEICRSHALVLRDPSPHVFLTSFAETSLRLNFQFWLADYRTQGQAVDEINSAIYARFQAEGIRMPPAERELRLAGAR